jgi:hypothetical protein
MKFPGQFKVTIDRDADTCKIIKETKNRISLSSLGGGGYGSPYGMFPFSIPTTNQQEIATLPLHQARALLLALKELEPELEYRKVVTATKLF